MKYEAECAKGGGGGDKDLTQKSAMTLITFDLETWFKVNVHPLHKNTQGIKYEEWGGVGAENMPWILIVEKTSRWKALSLSMYGLKPGSFQLLKFFHFLKKTIP